MDGAPLPTVIQKRPAPNSISVAGRSGDSFYIPEIDGLRAVAVVSVILYHLNAALMPGGFTGVDLFFVISGYVVSASLGRDAGQPFATMLRRFYARRILRIVPALLACLLVTTALTVLLIPNSWLSDTSPTLFLALAILRCFHPIPTSLRGQSPTPLLKPGHWRSRSSSTFSSQLYSFSGADWGIVRI